MQNDADIINFSITTTGYCPASQSYCPSNFQSVEDEIEAAYNAGVILVAAAGNTEFFGCDEDCGGGLPYLSYPAAYDLVIAVSATKQNDDFQNGWNYGTWVDVAAPGSGGIYTTHVTYNGYIALDGTSFAAPQVSALAALMLAANPNLTSDKIKSIIEQSADKVGQYAYINERNDYLGYGRINAYQALLLALAYENKSATQTATGNNNGRRLIKDTSGNYHLVFASGGEIFYRKNIGGNWQTPIRLTTGNGNNNYPSISESGGRIYTTWQRNVNTNNYYIYFTASMNEGTTWNNTYLLNSVTQSFDPLPAIQAVNTYEMVIFRCPTGIKSFWSYYTNPGSPPSYWIERIFGLNSSSNSPAITKVEGATNYFPATLSNSLDNCIYYYYFDPNNQNWQGPNNLSIIVPGSGSHLTPSLTNIPGSTQLHIAWKKLIGSGSTEYDHLIVTRKSTNHNNWPNQWYGTYYQKQEMPSISGLATNKVDLLYQEPAQFGNYIIKQRFNGTSWGTPTWITSNAKYPSVSSGSTTAKYVWASGSTAPYTVNLSTETLNKETEEINPIDYYSRSIALLDSSGNYIDLIIHSLGFRLNDGTVQRMNYSRGDIINFNLTNTNSWDSLGITSLSLIPKNINQFILDYSIEAKNINNVVNLTNFLAVEFNILGTQNTLLTFNSFNHPVVSNQINLVRKELIIPISSISNTINNIRASVKVKNILPKPGTFASLGHIFDYTNLTSNENLKNERTITQTEGIKDLLIQNYPNPFNPITKFNVALPNEGFVSLKIFDILGREITELVNNKLSIGTYEFEFNASAYPSGVYFYRLELEGEKPITKKMLFIK